MEHIYQANISSKQQPCAIGVRCQDELGKYCIVEIQVAKGPGFKKQAQYHAAKMYASLSLAEHFDQNFQGIIFIGIANFVIFPKQPALKSDHIVLDKATHDHDMQGMHITFFELPKFTKQIQEASKSFRLLVLLLEACYGDCVGRL